MVFITLVLVALGYLGLSRHQANQRPKLQPIRIREQEQTRRRR